MTGSNVAKADGTQYRTDGNLRKRLDLHRRFSTNANGWHRWVFDRFDLPADAHVLELGCGPGSLWRENRDRIAPGWRITLSDASPGMCASARDELRDVASIVSFEVIDAVSIPHADGAFDAVIANHMLYHVPDRAAALGEIRRVLRPGGRLYAATNGERHMWELDELIRAQAPELVATNVADRFGLENGLAQLTPWFAGVDRHDYADSLEVTQAGPLLDYALAMPGAERLTDGQRDRLRRAVTDAIARTGAFHVRKEVGMFRCLARE